MCVQDLLAQYAHVFHREHLRNARIVVAQPCVQALLGTLDNGVDFPKRVVEVERYGAYTVHW